MKLVLRSPRFFFVGPASSHLSGGIGYRYASTEELEREQLLRKEVLDKMGPGARKGAAEWASGAAAQANRGAESSGGSGEGDGKPGGAASGWNRSSFWGAKMELDSTAIFMLATGFLVTAYGSIYALRRLRGEGPKGRRADMWVLPSWCVPTAAEARRFMLYAITSSTERDRLRDEFESARSASTTGFFDWLDYTYPTWCAGNHYSAPQAVQETEKWLVEVQAQEPKNIAQSFNRVMRDYAVALRTRGTTAVGWGAVSQPSSASLAIASDKKMLVDLFLDIINGARGKIIPQTSLGFVGQPQQSVFVPRSQQESVEVSPRDLGQGRAEVSMSDILNESKR